MDSYGENVLEAVQQAEDLDTLLKGFGEAGGTTFREMSEMLNRLDRTMGMDKWGLIAG